MIKRIIIFTATIVLLFLIGYFTHNSFVENANEISRFSALSMYGFHAIASIIVYVLIETILSFLPNETGYMYLALMMIKLGVFLLMFQETIFSEKALTGLEKGVLIIPFFIFLIVETIGVGRLLNNSISHQENSK